MITSEIIRENSHQAKLYSQKLKNMRRHLESLLSKKIRIDLEIQELRKSIKEKEKSYERNIRINLNLEDTEVLEEIVQADASLLTETYNVLHFYQEFDREQEACRELLNYLEENQD